MLASVTAKGLSEINFDVAFSSLLSRDSETAKLIIDNNCYNKPQIIIDNRLREIYFGKREGLGITSNNFSILTDSSNDFYNDPFLFQNVPSGESIFDVCEQTAEFYHELIKKPELQDKTILLTTHGFALRCLLQQVYEDKVDFWHGKIPDNCAVNIIKVKNGKGTLGGDDSIYYDSDLCVNPYKPI